MTTVSSALTKSPDKINNILFENYTLSIKTSVCSYTSEITNNSLRKSSVPGAMTVSFSSCGANAIKVKYTNHKTSLKSSNTFIDIKPSQLGSTDETDDYIIFKSNLFEARISKSDIFSISFYYQDRFITSSYANNGGSSYTTSSGVASNYKISKSVSTSEALTTSPDELLYGTGSREASLLLNGRDLSILNTNSSGTSCPNYQNIPFYISSRNYGVFVNTTEKVNFSFGTEYSSCTSFGTEGEELEYIIFVGASMEEVMNTFVSMLGINHVGPSWSLGTSFLMNDDNSITDEDILNFVVASQDAGITVNEIWLSSSWLSPFDPLGFSFDPERFPEPAVFCRKLHERGVRLGLGVTPYISENSPFYYECLENDLLLLTSEGDVFIRDLECVGAAILDLTNIGARSFLQQRIDVLLKLGVDMIEADFKYHLLNFAEDEVAFFNGMRTSNACNYYSTVFNEAVYDVVSRSNGVANAMVITNSASIGAQLYPYTNISSDSSTFNSLCSAIRKSISLGLSGVSTVNIDTPALVPGVNDEVFLRYAELGFLVPHSRICVDAKNSLSAARKTFDTLKFFSNIRAGLLPHIYSIICEAANLGSPSMRMLSYEFPRDFAARLIDQQYMFGSNLMIVPVNNNSGSVTYYVPSGVWTNLLTRERIQGPCYKTSKTDLNSMPILVRPNSIVVTCLPDVNQNSDMLNNIVFTLFEPISGEISAFEVFDPNGHRGVINVLREGKKITVRTEGFGANKRIILSGIKNVVSVSESMPVANDFGTTIDFKNKELIITLA